MQIKNLTTAAALAPLLVLNTEEECPCMGSVEECPFCDPSPGEGEWPRSNDDYIYTPSVYDDGIPF